MIYWKNKHGSSGVNQENKKNMDVINTNMFTWLTLDAGNDYKDNHGHRIVLQGVWKDIESLTHRCGTDPG